MNEFLRFGRSVLDLLYPRQCQFCGSVRKCESFPFLCNDCFISAPLLKPPYCQVCGLPIVAGETCPNCNKTTLYFDQAIAITRFRGVVRYAIHSLKYSRQLYWSLVLKAWIKEWGRSTIDFAKIDLALPVPLHAVRERERGFNQAVILLEEFVSQWKIPMNQRVLSRSRKTETQTHLDREERRANLWGAFEVRAPSLVVGKRILLIDDVLTTGSTASECARMLREAGAISVLVFTLARG